MVCMDLDFIQSLGFTQKEIQVYEFLLLRGTATVGPICKGTNVHLSKSYSVLGRLKEKGLVSETVERGVKHFTALPPYGLFEKIKTQRKQLSDIEVKLEAVLPAIVNKIGKFQPTTTNSLEGLNAIKTFFYSELEKTPKKSEFIGFTLGDEFKSPEANQFFKAFHKERIHKQIQVKLIGLESQRDFLLGEYGKAKNYSFRFVELGIPTGLVIFKDKIAILQWREKPLAIIIQNQELANTYQKFFNQFWSFAQK